jgi:hypothetical protein
MFLKAYQLQTTMVAIPRIFPMLYVSWLFARDIYQKLLPQVQTLLKNESLRMALAIAIIPLSLTVPSMLGGNTSHDSTSAHAASPQVVAIPTTTDTFARKGINIGNDQSSTTDAPYQLAQNESDLAYLKGKVSRVRIALAYGLNTHDVNNLKRLAVEAKQDGFYVQFGITAGADPDVDTYYNQWLSTDIVSTAIWAQANHIDEFSIGNEEDWYAQAEGAFVTKTPTEIRNDVKSKVAEVRKVFSGSIVYSDAETTIDAWISEGIGGLDRIYFNVYDTLPNFQSLISKIVSHFGTNHAGIAEWSTQHGYDDMIRSGMTPSQYTQELMKRAAIVKNSGLPAYLFTLRMDPAGNDWGFILGDETKRPGFDEFLTS